jgi:hypothetical protein
LLVKFWIFVQIVDFVFVQQQAEPAPLRTLLRVGGAGIKVKDLQLHPLVSSRDSASSVDRQDAARFSQTFLSLHLLLVVALVRSSLQIPLKLQQPFAFVLKFTSFSFDLPSLF